MAKINDPSYLQPASWVSPGLKEAPSFTMLDGRQAMLYNKREDVSSVDVVGRGGVNFVRNGVSADKTFKWGESKEMASGTTNDGYPGLTKTAAEWRAFARSLPLYGLFIDQFLEDEWRVPNESDQYYAFVEERWLMHQEANKFNNSFLTYGAFILPLFRDWKIGGVQKLPTDNAFKKYYGNQALVRSDFAQYYLPIGGRSHSLHDLVWSSVKDYPQYPYEANDFCGHIWEMEVQKIGGSPGDPLGYVTTHFLETLPDSVNTSDGDIHIGIKMSRRLTSPAGLVKTAVHPYRDYDQMKASMFVMGLCIGNRLIYWDTPNQYGANPNTVYKNFGEGDVHTVEWFPDTPGTPMPLPSSGSGYPPERQIGYDALFSACHIYHEMRGTAGEEFAYLPYKIGNGSWIEPEADGSSILSHATAKRWVVMGRRSGNNRSHWAYNPFLSKRRSAAQTITVSNNGKDYTYQNLQGRVLHPYNEI